MKILMLGFAVVCFAGCVAPVTTAIYRHPESHDVATCVREDPGYASGLFGILDLLTVIDQTMASHRYAKCKTQLEAQGFTREGR